MTTKTKQQKKIEKELEEEKQTFISKQKFSIRFSVIELDKLYDSEKQNKLKFLAAKKAEHEDQLGEGKVKSLSLNRGDYEKCFPKCIQYIKDNIFPSDTSSFFYMVNIDKDGNLKPFECTKDLMYHKLSKFPEELQAWFKHHYLEEYRIDTDISMPRIYVHPKTGIRHLNVFTGYKYDGLEYNEVIHLKRKEDILFLWEHIKNKWCSGNDQVYQEVRKWICKLLIGKKKLKTAIYLKGPKGLGKSIIVELLTNILGGGISCHISKPEQIMKEFNGHLLGKVLAFIDDVEFKGEYFTSFGEAMKTNITEDTISFRCMYQNACDMQNVTTWLVAGNWDVGALGEGIVYRRWIICDVSLDVPDAEYALKLAHLCAAEYNDEEFWHAFYFDCMKNHDPSYIETLSIKSLPMTKTKQSQIQKTLPIDIRFFKEFINSPRLNEPLKKTEIYECFSDWFTKNKDNISLTKRPGIFDFVDTLRTHKSFINFKDGREDGMTIKDMIYIDRKAMIRNFRKCGYITDCDEIEDDEEHQQPIDIIKHNCLKIKDYEQQIDKLKEENVIQENLMLKSNNMFASADAKKEFDKQMDKFLPTLKSSQENEEVIDPDIIKSKVDEAFPKRKKPQQ